MHFVLHFYLCVCVFMCTHPCIFVCGSVRVDHPWGTCGNPRTSYVCLHFLPCLRQDLLLPATGSAEPAGLLPS